MKLALLDFQDEYNAIFLERLGRAKRHVRDEELQAVLLSAPTGSGKTVMMTDLIEKILFGTDGFEAEPDAVFLWLSDQPELNEQSRNRILSASDRLRSASLIMVNPDFDAETFTGGNVYFLNTQKLARTALLTQKGDRRQYTIWETIENTARAKPDRFYVIIDEAHRGMSTSRESEEAQRIAEKFLIGDTAEGLSPAPLIIGVSATPERFERRVAKTDRYVYKVNVDPARVRESGLLKERLLVVTPDSERPSDWSLLQAAGMRWQRMREEWADYCLSQDIPLVEPILVVQVEDASGDRPTKTDLSTLFTTLETALGPLDDDQLAHAFQEDRDITIADHRIRKIDPSKIVSDPRVRVVFFKMALSTGWDCPRAEVLMSFRRAVDSTLIAQLIGRMVRAPLARRIEDRDTLNNVYLYLPYYDRTAVDAFAQKLAGDPENVPPTDVENANGFSDLQVPVKFEEAREFLNGKPSYVLREGRKLSDLRRLLRFASLLATVDAIDPQALVQSRDLIVSRLISLRANLLSEKSFQEALTNATTLRVRPLIIHPLNATVTPGEEEVITLSDANIDELYRRAKQRLGDDIVVEYLRRVLDATEPNEAKLEIYLLAQREDVLRQIESLAKETIQKLRRAHGAAIDALPSSKQIRYRELWSLAKTPEISSFFLPRTLTWSPETDARPYAKHLYQSAKGQFCTALKSWESRLVELVLAQPDVECWFRNLPNKPWSFSYYYEASDGTYHSGYPDLLVVRTHDGNRSLEVYEPHGEHLTDGWRKTKGMARLADSHAGAFGRIAVARKVDDQITMLDLLDDTIRERALRLANDGDLDNLFYDRGVVFFGN